MFKRNKKETKEEAVTRNQKTVTRHQTTNGRNQESRAFRQRLKRPRGTRRGWRDPARTKRRCLQPTPMTLHKTKNSKRPSPAGRAGHRQGRNDTKNTNLQAGLRGNHVYLIYTPGRWRAESKTFKDAASSRRP